MPAEQATPAPRLSVVVPVYNEEESLPELCRQLFAALDRHAIDSEVLFVDDGSRDRSFALLREVAGGEPRARVIRFARNYGQTAAMAAGFAAARGAVVAPLDADLQNNPDDIPRLLVKIDEGFDVVSGWRKSRQDRFLSRRLPSILANRLISTITHVRLHDYGCTLKAYRREVLDKINLYGELHRFVPALAFQVGARIAEVPVDHRPRLVGESKYGIDRTLRVVLDLMTVKFLLKYATRPLQLFGKWAFGAAALAFATFGMTLWMKFVDGLSMNRNPLLILSALLLFSAVQFIAIGLLGELITRTYHEVQDKPIYTIRETVNLENT